jgi:hypothetical protein
MIEDISIPLGTLGRRNYLGLNWKLSNSGIIEKQKLVL